MARTPFALPFTAEPVLDFELSSSHVTVLATEHGEAPSLETVGRGEPLSITAVDGAVKVRLSESGGSSWFREPPHRVFLHLPAHVRAQLRVDMGQLDIKGLRGCDLTASTNAGQLELTDVDGRLQLEANAGKLVGTRVGGTFVVKAGAGAVRLFVVRLDEGTHAVHSSMGSVRIELPPGLDVRIDSHTVMGSTRTHYPNNPDAKTVLKLEAELGSVKVVEGSTYADPRRGDFVDWRKRWLDRASWNAPRSSSPPTAAPTVAVSRGPSTDELRSILSMVEEKKISATDAERLIRALDGR